MIEVHALARDACVALGIPEIPKPPVWLADPDFDFDGIWQHKVPKKIANRVAIAGSKKRKRWEKDYTYRGKARIKESGSPGFGRSYKPTARGKGI